MNTNIIIIGPNEDLIEKVYSLLLPEYPLNLIVFPGKRPAYYLRKLIGERVGSAFISPEIYSIDEFINLLFKGDQRPVEVIDTIAILYEQLKDSPAIHREFKKLDNFYSFGIRLFRCLEELYIEYISPEKLREVETLVEIPEKAASDIRFLADLYKGFYEEMKNKKLSTRSSRYREVAETEPLQLLNKKNIKRLIFAGFFAFTETEKRCIKKIFLDESEIERFMVFQYGDGIEDTLKSLGFTLGDLDIYKKEERIRALEEKLFLYSAPDIHGEVKAVGTKLKELNRLDERTAIILPMADTLFPLIRQGIPYLKDEFYNISMGYPLTKTPIYGFFVNLFETITSIQDNLIYIPYYLKFVLHPCVKNILFRGNAELNRIIIHTMEDLFKNKQIQPFITLEDIESIMSEKIFNIVRDTSLEQATVEEPITSADIKRQLIFIHDNTIRRFMKLDSIGEFARNCIEVLLFIYAHSTAKYHPLFFPYVEGFINELDKVSVSSIKDLSFERRESYFNFFKKLIPYNYIPFEGTPLRGLQILGFLETRNIKFRRVFFLDLNEGVFPELSEDYILPYTLRKSLGLPTYHDRERLMYYYFDILLKGAEEIHLFYIENENTERSRFIEKVLWQIESTTKTQIHKSTVNYKIKLQTLTPQPIKKSDEVVSILDNFTWSSSSLDEYLNCGIKFYYSYILNLKENEYVTGEITRKEIGSIIHRSLMRYFQMRSGRPLKREDFSGEDISRIVYEIFRERYGTVFGRLYLVRYQIIKKLKDFLKNFPSVIKEGARIIGIEEPIRNQLFNHFFSGIADLVLLIGDGRIVIIDFKISSNKNKIEINFNKLDLNYRKTWSEAIKSIQIPLYMMLYSNNGAIDMEIIDGYYILLGRNSIKENNIIYSPFKDVNKKEALKLLYKVVKDLIDEIKSADIPFNPPIDLKGSCPECAFRPLCGTEWVARSWRR